MEIIVAAVAFAFVIGLFIIGREFVLWYFRVNQMADTLKSIDTKLALLIPVAPDTKEQP